MTGIRPRCSFGNSTGGREWKPSVDTATARFDQAYPSNHALFWRFSDRVSLRLRRNRCRIGQIRRGESPRRFPGFRCAMSSEEEQEVLRRIRAGDTEQFRFFVERYQRELFALIYRQVGDRSIAEDLVQDCFLRAFRGLDQFRAESAFKTWLLRIAFNVTNSYFVSRRFKERAMQTPLGTSASEIPVDEYDYETEKRLVLLRRAIGRLHEKYRTVVALCILQKYSYEEASEILGIPSGTVGSRINKAIALLHDDLQRMIEDEAA